MGADEAEIWRPVVGWEGRYEVSSMGRVRSTPAVRGGGKVLSPSFMKGYPKIIFTDGKRRETFQIHRLVLLAFVGPPPTGFEAAHLNGVRDDARLSNLRWVTRKENAGHKNEHGTMQRGDTHSTSILTTEAVRYIRGNLNNKSFAEMGRELGVSEATVANAAKGEKWRHIFCTECDRLSKELETERAKSALLAGRLEELERGLGMIGRAIYDGAPDTLWLLEEDAINMTAVECIDGLLSRAPTAPREAAKDYCRVVASGHVVIDEPHGLEDWSGGATPTESTGAKCRCTSNWKMNDWYADGCQIHGATPTSEEKDK